MARSSGSQAFTQPELDACDELEAVEQLYLEHGAFVWRAAARLGVPETEREDLVHDVFLVVHRRLEGFEGRSAMTSWLYGIARGVVWNRNRKDQRRASHLRACPDVAHERVNDLSADAEAADAIARFLASLDAPRREVFELAELEGMSGPEIAQALSVNTNTVYTRLRAARRAFRSFAEHEVAHG